MVLKKLQLKEVVVPCPWCRGGRSIVQVGYSKVNAFLYLH